MSPGLDESDIDRIGLRVEVAVGRAMEEMRKELAAALKDHKIVDHDPLCAKVDNLRESFWKWSGAVGLATFLIGLGISFLAR